MMTVEDIIEGFLIETEETEEYKQYTAELLSDETITKIANAHGVSSAQVILRWDLQNGVVVIPGSSNPDHILENTKLYDFELTDKEMSSIKALNRDEKHDWY